MIHWLIFGIVAVLLFGNRLPSVARSLGRSFVEFKKGMSDIESEFKSQVAGRRSIHRASAAGAPAVGATASPVKALLMLRSAAPADAGRGASRLRHVIHMYCVQICSSASN